MSHTLIHERVRLAQQGRSPHVIYRMASGWFSEPALYAHIVPRYDSAPEHLRRRPVWFYDWSEALEFDRDSFRSFIDAVTKGLEMRR